MFWIYVIIAYLVAIAAAVLVFSRISKKNQVRDKEGINKITSLAARGKPVVLRCWNLKYLFIGGALYFAGLAAVLVPGVPARFFFVVLYGGLGWCFIFLLWRIPLTWRDGQCSINNKPRLLTGYSISWFLGNTGQVIYLRTDKGVYMLAPVTFSEMMGGYAGRQVIRDEMTHKTEQVLLLEEVLKQSGVKKEKFFNYGWLLLYAGIVLVISSLVPLFFCNQCG